MVATAVATDSQSSDGIRPEEYARWRETYLGALTERIEAGAVLDSSGDLSGKRLLDLGCGDGTYSIAASQKGALVTGLDISEAVLEAANDGEYIVGNKPTRTERSTNMLVNVLRLIISFSMAALVGAWNVPMGLAQEQGHPAPPTAAPTAASAVTLEDVAQQIESYAKRESKDGTFQFEDKATGKQLSLTLDRVHRERLSQVGPDMFFACVDFKSSDGNVYDLDFFVRGTSKDNLRVLPEKTSVHKENGKERYTWAFNAEKGIWEQKPVGTEAKEHPIREHPK